MANKKIGVVNNDNLDFFITYISNKPKKMSRDLVERLILRADKASLDAYNKQVRFAVKNDIDAAMLIYTWTEEQQTLIACAHVSCYQELNDYIDTLDFDLRSSFRNANNQRLHKIANKKHNFEVNDEIFYQLKQLRTLCAELNIEIIDVLRDKNRELSKQVKK